MRLGEKSLQHVLDDLASSSPAPGGGSAAALAAAIAASLVQMAAGIARSKALRGSRGGPCPARDHDAIPSEQELDGICRDMDRARRELVELADMDSEAFTAVVAAVRKARKSRGDAGEAKAALEAASVALEAAARVPLRVAELSGEVARAASGLGYRRIGGCALDARVAGVLAKAAQVTAALNVRANLDHDLIRPEAARSMTQELNNLTRCEEEGLDVIERTQDPTLGKGRRALVVVDCLVDFMHPAGRLFVGQSGRDIIPSCRRELDAARARGDRVIFVCDTHRPDDSEFRMFPPHCVEGSGGEKVIPELAPAPGELVVPKQRFSGFFGTGLDLALREGGVSELTLIGVCTNICVLYTCADARMRGYEVEVVADAVASFDQGAHEWALGEMTSVLGARVRAG